MNNERNTPATRGDIHDLEAHATEAIYDSETRLLRAFYWVIESNQKRP